MTNLPVHLDLNFGKGVDADEFEKDGLYINQALCQPIIQTALTFALKDGSFDHKTNKPASISLYLVEANEGRQLNHDYRGKDYATNVLSFESELSKLPAELIKDMDDVPLGELVICLPVVAREAAEQGKPVQDHFTHLLVHGCLHLLGFDHELGNCKSDDPTALVTEADAEAMESLEVKILAALGLDNPYQLAGEN